MKTRVSILSTIFLLTISVILSAVLVFFSVRPAEPISQGAGAVPIEQAGNDYEYLLKNYNGHLAVFTKGATNPDLIFDVYVKSLPEFDRDQLEQGVAARSYAELVSLIEDYTS